jgi:hypothetical protein
MRFFVGELKFVPLYKQGMCRWIGLLEILTFVRSDIFCQQFYQFLELINRNWSFHCARWSIPVIPKTNINTPHQKKLSAQRTGKNCIFKIKHSPTSIRRSLRQREAAAPQHSTPS